MFDKKKFKELVNLGKRIYEDNMVVKNENGTMIYEDEDMIKDICNMTFGTSENPKNPKLNSNLELFNEFIIKTVEEIAQPTVDYILSLISDFNTVPKGAIQYYRMEKTTEPKWLYTAKGTGVDLVRLSGSDTRVIAQPESLTFGGYYETTTFRADPIREFRNTVDRLARAEIDLYFKLAMDAFKECVDNAKIPEGNGANGTNLSIRDFQKAEQSMIRLTNARPLFIGDIALINHFANEQVQDQTVLLTDKVKDMMREDLVPSMISKTVAIPFPNTWIDDKNTKVKFDPSLGFVFAGGANGKKPFAITKFGSPRQYSIFDEVTERVELKVVMEVNVTLLNCRYIGAIIDDSVK